MSARATGTRITWALLALIALLGAAIMAQLSADRAPLAGDPARHVPAAADAPATPVTPEALDTGLGPIERYAAVVERPLFDPTRRPPPAATAQVREAPVPPPTQFALEGVVLAPGKRSAIFRNITTSKMLHVGEGARLGEWVVETLETDRAVLRHGDGAHELALRHFDTAPSSGGGARPTTQHKRHPTR